MTDDLDVLRRERDVIEPDPQFRAELMARLSSEMAWGHDVVLTGSTDTTVSDERHTNAPFEHYVSDGPRRHPWRWLAVAAVVLLVATVVAVIRHGESEREVNTLPLAITGLARGETTELPRGPIIARRGPAVVWTGSEMIVWGGAAKLLDGAAFDPATGSWREIAPAPLEPRDASQVAWTGTEMLVVGGIDVGHQFEYPSDGAAYDPATDTWRPLPDAPIDPAMGEPAWTGQELVVVGLNHAESERRAAAYDPEANEWRELAPPPRRVGGLVWTGEVVLAAAYAPNPDGSVADTPTSLLRYDLESDRWHSISDESYAYLLPVPDDQGEVRSVLAVPTESGAPVAVYDRDGDLERTLPGVPGARESFGDRIQPSGQGTWLGEEALFWMVSLDSPMRSLQTPAPWALDPETGTWRSLGTSAPPFSANLELLAEAGLLIGWGPLSGDVDAPSVGIAYRPPGLDDDITVLPERFGLPEPGTPPADPAAAEEQVRTAFLTLFDASLPREQRAEAVERPEVWIAANRDLLDGGLGEYVKGQYAEVDEVVFASPTTAAVRFRLVLPNDDVPDGHEGFAVGDAVLVDGRWRVAISTPCDQLARAAVQCNMNL